MLATTGSTGIDSRLARQLPSAAVFSVYKLVWRPSGRYYYGYTSRLVADRVAELEFSGSDQVRQAYRDEGQPQRTVAAIYTDEGSAIERERSLIAAAHKDSLCLNEA